MTDERKMKDAIARDFMRQGFGSDEAWRRARLLEEDNERLRAFKKWALNELARRPARINAPEEARTAG